MAECGSGCAASTTLHAQKHMGRLAGALMTDQRIERSVIPKPGGRPRKVTPAEAPVS